MFESQGDSVCRCESWGLNGYLSLLMGNRLPDHGQMDRNAQDDQREAKNQTYCILSKVIRHYRKKKHNFVDTFKHNYSLVLPEDPAGELHQSLDTFFVILLLLFSIIRKDSRFNQAGSLA